MPLVKRQKTKMFTIGPGISIKLSALHPRYQRAQVARMHEELYGKVFTLAKLARGYNIGLNIDAEESERLEISLEMLERLCFEPELKEWERHWFRYPSVSKTLLLRG